MFWALRIQANQEISIRIEANQFKDDEVISLKIPMTLPYLMGDGSYRSVTGEVEHHGEFYKLIKQKQDGDTLVIVCVKNQVKKHLVKKMIDYSNLSNDFPASSKKTQSLLSKLFKEYASFQQNKIISSQGWAIKHVSYTISSFSSVTFESAVQGPPPRYLS